MKRVIGLAAALILTFALSSPAHAQIYGGRYYYNPWTGMGAGVGAAYSPFTGAYYGSAAAYNPWAGYYGSAAAYNPWAGLYIQRNTYVNPYTGMWGTSRGFYNPYTGLYGYRYRGW